VAVFVGDDLRTLQNGLSRGLAARRRFVAQRIDCNLPARARIRDGEIVVAGPAVIAISPVSWGGTGEDLCSGGRRVITVGSKRVFSVTGL